MFLGTGKHIDLDYFLPLSDPKNQGETSHDFNPIWAIQNAASIEENDDMGMEITENEELEAQRKDEESQRDKDEAMMKLDKVLEKMRTIFADRIEHDPKGYNKALAKLEKHLDRMPKSNDARIQKAACNFGEDAVTPLRSKKHKRSHLIPVQVQFSQVVALIVVVGK